MPKLIFEGEEITVKANESCVEPGESLGIPFSCTDGNCGTCLVRVKKGLENLSPWTKQEEDFGLDKDERLLCQARIISGEVEVEL